VHKGALQSIKVCKWLRVKKKNSYALTLTTISVKITKNLAKRKENSALARELQEIFYLRFRKTKCQEISGTLAKFQIYRT
jgi:hypothetical protein